MLKLLVVEDHALVREGLVRLLAQMERGSRSRRRRFRDGLECAGKRRRVRTSCCSTWPLPGIDGFAGLDILRRRYPPCRVAVVSHFNDLPTITRVLNLGASGFIPKAFSGEALLSAVRQVLAGNIFRPSSQSARRHARCRKHPSRSPRAACGRMKSALPTARPRCSP